LKSITALLLFLFCFGNTQAQYTFHKGILPDEASLIDYATITNTGSRQLSIDEAISQQAQLRFKTMDGKFGNLGFTKDNFWIRFQLKNTLDTPIVYYLHTAEPVTDRVDLYLINQKQERELQRSGDNIDFAQRTIAHRKTIFKITLHAGETKSAWLYIKNDGEKNSLPLTLISEQRMLSQTYLDQLLMGLFYGILLMIAITYFFFYVALKQLSFLYYTLFVISMGLCQFALDGLYHQYIGTSASWLDRHMVIISAIFSCFFFARYSEIVLNIKGNNRRLHRLFKPLYAGLVLVLAGILFVPGFLSWSYPIVNLLTLLGILLIFLCIGVLFYKKQSLDIFYTIGIFILSITLVLAVLMNFGIMPEDFSMEDVTKPGIALEIIALSLSMANQIRVLKSKEQESQALALQKSQEMNDVKSYFLANMSHELRTPLNAIVGLADLMEQESADPKLRANCEIIKYTSHSLISSVTDILDYSKIEKGEMVLEQVQFDPHQITHKIAQSTEKQCADKGIQFRFSSSLCARRKLIGDPLRLEQIIYNVISNAVKFTSEGKVSFDIKTREVNDRQEMRILISDTGVGIPAEKLDAVFHLFAQTDFDNKRKYGGFGIGLSIVKALTDLHGGEINIDSTVNFGTKCEILLSYPIDTEEVPVLNKFPLEYFDLLNSHVLIVEDNPMNQMIIKMMMRDWANTTIHIANNGQECLDLMKQQQMDIVLMDLQMPVMDGYEATQAIKEGQLGVDNAAVPVIVITADTTAASKERIMEIGADDYMNKPIEKELLYEKITTALSNRI
jgi:signal transduction histidine kinase/CheY-like chemotaxis protein